MRRFGLLPVIYIVIGLLVAGSVIGDERNYFNDLDSLEAIVEMLLAVLLWPLVLLGVGLDIGGGGDSGAGGDAGGGGGSDAGGGSNGGSSGGNN